MSGGGGRSTNAKPSSIKRLQTIQNSTLRVVTGKYLADAEGEAEEGAEQVAEEPAEDKLEAVRKLLEKADSKRKQIRRRTKTKTKGSDNLGPRYLDREKISRSKRRQNMSGTTRLMKFN